MLESHFHFGNRTKGVNFRDGHSCSSRCGPSRYCLLTGRYPIRQGHYNYKPMEVEHGRKLMSHMFKRNNYKTFVFGKMDPLHWGGARGSTNSTNHFWSYGATAQGFDRSGVA